MYDIDGVSSGPRPLAAVATFGELTEPKSKMAHGIIRYCPHVVAVIDPVHHGRNASDVVPYCRRNTPVVASLAEAQRLGAAEVVLGVTPHSGPYGTEVMTVVRRALIDGMWVVHGMRESIRAHPALEGLGFRLIELRHLPAPERVAEGASTRIEKPIVLTIGSDSRSGKLTTCLELVGHLRRQGVAAGFVPTGQTGMYIVGGGAAIDNVRADFVAGVVENLVLEKSQADFIIVEGQGSILHPAFGGVSLALLQGSSPDFTIFCHDVSRRKLDYTSFPMSDLGLQLSAVEQLAAPQKKTQIAAISAMTSDPDLDMASEIRLLETDSGVPVVDIERNPTTDLPRLAALIGVNSID